MATPIPHNAAAFTLGEVVSATGGTFEGDLGAQVCGVAIDSRAVVPGGLFVAVRGERVDGHGFLEAARSAGAGAALVRRDEPAPEGLACVAVDDTTRALGDLARYHRQRWGGKVIAITGSAGKTTTKELTAGALAALGRSVLKTPGNLNNQFGVPMTLLMLEASHDVAVLEVGTSAPGEIAYLGELVKPDVAAVLLAAAAHTEGLGSVEAVAREKASLWKSLGEGGWAVVGADDGLLPRLCEGQPQRLSFGRAEGADVALVEATTTTTGTAIRLRLGAVEHVAQLRLLGEPAALDACCALACVVALEGEAAAVSALGGLAQVEPTPGRLALTRAPAGYWVLDDSYNANPESTVLGLRALVELAENTGGRAIAVLGEMRELGSLSRAAHQRVGERSVELGAAVLIGTGTEMNHGTAAAVRAAAGRFGKHPTQVMQLADKREILRVLRGMLRPDDVVLVKGSRSVQLEDVATPLARGTTA